MISAGDDMRRGVAETFRWRRRLGARLIGAPYCEIVADPARPEVWDSNHADAIVARGADEIGAVFTAMERHLAHSRWRVAHTDALTPDPFLARLAFEDFCERPLTIQMAREGRAAQARPLDLRPVESEAQWRELSALVRLNHGEGRTTGDLAMDAQTSAAMVAGYRAKHPHFRYRLAYEQGEAVAYGGCGAAPNGFGVIEDLFTRPDRRRRGIATAMIAAIIEELACGVVFLGALAAERPKRLYARLGFAPVALARVWVKDTLDSAR